MKSIKIAEIDNVEQKALIEPEKFSEWRWFGEKEYPENFINPAALNLIKNYLTN